MGAVRQAFGKNLAYHRERLRLTQARLAEAVETSPSYIGHLERGERDPSLVTIEELAKALGIRAGEFFVERNGSGDIAPVAQEVHELLRGRADEDVRLVIRLARAAFEDPRLASDLPVDGDRARGRVARAEHHSRPVKKRARARARTR